MPTYEYECKSCLHSFEVFQAMSDASLKECPECGNEVRRVIHGGTGVIFKGSGFYVTDKNKASSSSAGKSSSVKSDDKVSPCSDCPAAGETGKCPVKSSEMSGEVSSGKSKPDTKSA